MERIKGQTVRKNVWEEVDDNTERLRVPGGWLVRTFIILTHLSTSACSVHMVFVEDPSNAWVKPT
jgi:hypothetical protein